MKKVFINELETEKRDELIKKNEKLLYLLRDNFMEMLSYQQEEAECSIMNKESLNSIEYHSNYNSFFYTLKDWKKFYDNINYLYLSDEASDRHDKIQKNVEKMDALPEYNNEYYELDNECEQLAKEILKEIEEYLHAYEEAPEDDEVIRYADEMEQLNKYYIEEHEDGFSDGVIRRDISYTETFI